jgi:hypothetical protein
LIKVQNEAFMRIAARVAETHKEADALRQLYIESVFDRKRNFPSSNGGPNSRGLNPFDAADKKELAEKKAQAQRLKSESVSFQQSLPATPQQQQPAQAAQLTNTPAWGTGTPAAAAPAAAATGFGLGGGGFALSSSATAAPAAVPFSQGFAALGGPTAGFGLTAAPAAQGFGLQGFGVGAPVNNISTKPKSKKKT